MILAYGAVEYQKEQIRDHKDNIVKAQELFTQ